MYTILPPPQYTMHYISYCILTHYICIRDTYPLYIYLLYTIYSYSIRDTILYIHIQEAEKAAKEAARKAAEEEEARRILEEFTNKYAVINLADGTTVTPTTPTTTSDQVKVLREVGI